MGPMDAVGEALQCPEDCDFLIAVCGHDRDVIAAGIEAYDSCPNCGEDLVTANVIVQGRRVDVYR